MIIVVMLVAAFSVSCSGSPSIKVKGNCLADSHCETGYFCNDSYKCQKLPGFDGDEESLEQEADEDSEASEEIEVAEEG